MVSAVCEVDCKFVDLYKNDSNFDDVKQISAGKFRRYSNRKLYEKLLDFKTPLLNIRDMYRVFKGYRQAINYLKLAKPDAILIKGGFVGVPLGKAAKKLGIPYMTHDSDSTPGLANRLIANGAALHATGMPKEMYNYNQDITHFTGVPVSDDFVFVDEKLKQKYKQDIGLGQCNKVVAVIGGSQGGSQLNEDIIAIAGRLMQKHTGIGLVHFAGPNKLDDTRDAYKKELLADELRNVVTIGFADDAFRYTGAADIIVSRASATVTAELAIQGKTVIFVPGRLAGAHQDKNAKLLESQGRAMVVEYADREGLFSSIDKLLIDSKRSNELADKLHDLAKPKAAKELAELVVGLAKGM